jgi:hypothetical protein
VLKQSIQPADTYVHDMIGHGIMGMCHVDHALIGGNDKSLMAGGPGTFLELVPRFPAWLERPLEVAPSLRQRGLLTYGNTRVVVL